MGLRVSRAEVWKARREMHWVHMVEARTPLWAVGGNEGFEGEHIRHAPGSENTAVKGKSCPPGPYTPGSCKTPKAKQQCS